MTKPKDATEDFDAFNCSSAFEVVRPRIPNTDSMMIDSRYREGYLWVRRTGTRMWCCTYLQSRFELDEAIAKVGVEPYLQKTEAIERSRQYCKVCIHFVSRWGEKHRCTKHGHHPNDDDRCDDFQW